MMHILNVIVLSQIKERLYKPRVHMKQKFQNLLFCHFYTGGHISDHPFNYSKKFLSYLADISEVTTSLFC